MLLITEVHSPTKMFSITTNACTKQWRSHRVHFFTGLQSQQRSKQESDLSRADTADTTLLQRGEPQKQMAHKCASVSCIPFLCTGLKGLSWWRAKWRLSLAKAAKHTHILSWCSAPASPDTTHCSLRSNSHHSGVPISWGQSHQEIGH